MLQALKKKITSCFLCLEAAEDKLSSSTEKMVGPGGPVMCGPYSEVPAWGQSIIKQDNAGVGKAASPEESIFYSIWYTMETAAQVGWLLHTQKVLCLCIWRLPPCREFAFSPSSEHVSSAASVDRTTHKAKSCSQGYRHKPHGREQDLGLPQTKQSLVTANHFSWDTDCWRSSLSWIHERAEIVQVSPLLFFSRLCHSKTDTSAISSSLHIHLASSSQQGKNLQQCHLSSWLKMAEGTKPKFSQRGSISERSYVFWFLGCLTWGIANLFLLVAQYRQSSWLQMENDSDCMEDALNISAYCRWKTNYVVYKLHCALSGSWDKRIWREPQSWDPADACSWH